MSLLTLHGLRGPGRKQSNRLLYLQKMPPWFADPKNRTLFERPQIERSPDQDACGMGG